MKTASQIFLFFLLFLSLVGCNKEEFEEYYARPESLEDPVYQILESRGNFTNLLTLVDRAGYKDILDRAGYWTMFAPNDAAFQKFFQQNPNYNGLADIDSIVAQQIVKYALVYNAFRTDRISDFQSQGGWVPDLAFKRRTAYYDPFDTVMVDGEEIVTIGSGRNSTLEGYVYVPSDNNKYIPYFHESFMEANNLSAVDYNYFYPNQPFTGFNVVNGEVVNENIIAENGIIHEVSEVILPLKNLDQYIADNQEYSLFKSVLDEYLVEYLPNDEATRLYQTSTGGSEQVYVKFYDPALAFAPNNENHLGLFGPNDAQVDSYTMFVPQNDVFQEFIDEILLEHYPSLDALPKFVFVDLVNAHMWQNAVWPSRFYANINLLEEEPRVDRNTNVVDKEVLSNGIFYGTNKVQQSNVFYSVYTSAYLDPDYSLMTRAINDPTEGYKRAVSNIGREYTLFLVSDQVLRQMGYGYDEREEYWTYTDPLTGETETGEDAKRRIMEVLDNHYASTPNGELNDLSGSGMFRSGDSELPGQYIKYENNRVYAAGNLDMGNAVNIIDYEDQGNGRVYYTDNLLQPSYKPLAFKIRELAGTGQADGGQDLETPFSSFFKYLSNSDRYDPETGGFRGIQLGSPYTVVIPNNEAIQQAVEDGVLPGTETENGLVPNFDPGDVNDQAAVDRFILYHLIENTIIAPDGLEEGLFATALNDEFDDPIYMTVQNEPGSLRFEGRQNRVAEIIPSHSNNLAMNALIHLVDNYLLYNE